MIKTYKQNEANYQKILGYIDIKVLDKTLKKEIRNVLEKYKSCIYEMEIQDVEKLIQECVENKSTQILQDECHSVIFGRSDISSVKDQSIQQETGFER